MSLQDPAFTRVETAKHLARSTFLEWAKNYIQLDPLFQRKILFSGEAHFWLNGYVNKHNFRISNGENSETLIKIPLHPLKVTIWCTLWAGRIIGPYYFEDDAGQIVTFNEELYRAIIADFFGPQLNGVDMAEFWFQQDGATCSIARDIINLLW